MKDSRDKETKVSTVGTKPERPRTLEQNDLNIASVLEGKDTHQCLIDNSVDYGSCVTDNGNSLGGHSGLRSALYII